MKCQHCDAEITRAEIDSLESEYVAHAYPSDDGFGQITDYYCDTDCAQWAFESR